MVQGCIVFPNGNETLGKTPAFRRSMKFSATGTLSSHVFLMPLAEAAVSAFVSCDGFRT